MAQSLINNAIGKLTSYRLGFHLHENMIGSHEFEAGCGPSGQRPMSFSIRWGPKDLLTWINVFGDRFMSQPLKGTITIDGLCHEAPCTGTLELKYYQEHKIRYTIHFRIDDTDYTYVGEKVNIRPWNLPVSHTTCYGTLTECGSSKVLSKSITYFRLRDMPSFAASFRLAVSANASP